MVLSTALVVNFRLFGDMMPYRLVIFLLNLFGLHRESRQQTLPKSPSVIKGRGAVISQMVLIFKRNSLETGNLMAAVVPISFSVVMADILTVCASTELYIQKSRPTSPC
jgi:hypothetical protein